MVGAFGTFQSPRGMRDLQPNVPKETNVYAEVVAQLPGVIIVLVVAELVVDAVVGVRARNK